MAMNNNDHSSREIISKRWAYCQRLSEILEHFYNHNAFCPLDLWPEERDECQKKAHWPSPGPDQTIPHQMRLCARAVKHVCAVDDGIVIGWAQCRGVTCYRMLPQSHSHTLCSPSCPHSAPKTPPAGEEGAVSTATKHPP